jgi:hypothetical protein
MPGNLKKLYSAAMDKLHGRPKEHHHADFEDTWTRVVTDYGELWERKKSPAAGQAPAHAAPAKDGGR